MTNQHTPPIWPKEKLLRTGPELPMAERIRRYQHNICAIRESGCMVPSTAMVDSLDEAEIRAWFEAGERRIGNLKRAITFVASLPVDEDGYAIFPEENATEELEPAPVATDRDAPAEPIITVKRVYAIDTIAVRMFNRLRQVAAVVDATSGMVLAIEADFTSDLAATAALCRAVIAWGAPACVVVDDVSAPELEALCTTRGIEFRRRKPWQSAEPNPAEGAVRKLVHRHVTDGEGGKAYVPIAAAEEAASARAQCQQARISGHLQERDRSQLG